MIMKNQHIKKIYMLKIKRTKNNFVLFEEYGNWIFYEGKYWLSMKNQL